MKLIANILWFVLVGIWSFVAWVFVGLLWCVTLIGIPFGLQCFKIAKFSAFPFGSEIVTNFDKHPLANIIWLVLFGWEIALGYLFAGIILCITIIGIPFGKQAFKLARLSLLPFGSSFKS